MIGNNSLEFAATAPASNPPCKPTAANHTQKMPPKAGSAPWEHRLCHITEPSHVFHRFGDRPGRTLRAAENDRRRVGRRQERLARRNDQPALGFGRGRTRWLCHHGTCVPPVPEARRPGAAHPGAAGHAGHRRRACAGRSRRADPPVDRGHAVPGRPAGSGQRAVRDADARQPRRVLRRAFLGHRRGPAGRILRRAAGDLPQRQRHRAGAAQDEGGLRLALQRPRHQLPRAQGLRARRRGAVGRRAAHGALRPGSGRRDVHHRHRVRLQGRGLHHLELRPGRDGGAGRGEPGRVLRAQAHAEERQVSDHPAQPGQQADPHGVRQRAGARCRRAPGAHRGHRAGAAQPLFAQRCRRDRTVALCADHRAALRPSDGHRVGQGRPGRQALHPAGPARDGEEPGRGQGRAALPPHRRPREERGAGRRPRHRPEDRHRPGAADPLAGRDGAGAAGRRARHRHDRSRTGSR